MKFILTVVLVAIVSCLYGAHIESQIMDAIAEVIEEKCNANAHNNVAFRDLMNALDPFIHCVETSIGQPPPHPINEYNNFCALLGNGNYYTCIDNLTKKVSPCLEADEAYLPNFALTSFNASYEEFCGTNGANRVNAIANDIQSSTCLTNHLSPSIIQRRCIRNLTVYQNIDNEIFTIKKTDLCSDLRFFKGCIIQLLKDRCNEDHTETVNFFIDPYIAAC